MFQEAQRLENDAMYREYNRLRNDCTQQLFAILNERDAYKEQLEKIQTTNQLNYPLESNVE
jgi:hypothetical protein